MDCRPPDSSVLGILQARILEWVAISFSWGSSQPRDQNWVSCIAGRFFCATREAPYVYLFWPYGYAFYEMAIWLSPLSIFKIVCFDLWEFLIYSALKTFVNYNIYHAFSHFMAYFFYSLLDFDKTKFLILIVFSLWLLLWGNFQERFAYKLLMTFFKLFSISFVILTCLELIFGYHIKKVSKSTSFHLDNQMIQHHLLQIPSFPHCITMTPLSYIRCMCRSISGLLFPFYYSIYSSLHLFRKDLTKQA